MSETTEAAVEAAARALDGATTLTPEAAYPGTPGEFAADWNAWDETRRAAFLAASVQNATEASRCFRMNHEALLDEVRSLSERVAKAYSEGYLAALDAVSRELDVTR